MKRFIKKSLNRLPFIKSINDQLRNQNEQVRKQGAYPAGHYYSPIPAEEDVLAYVKSGNPPGSELLGIDLNGEVQKELLDEYIKFYQEIPSRMRLNPDTDITTKTLGLAAMTPFFSIPF